MIICNRAAKWWGEEVKEAIRVRRETHAMKMYVFIE